MVILPHIDCCLHLSHFLSFKPLLIYMRTILLPCGRSVFSRAFVKEWSRIPFMYVLCPYASSLLKKTLTLMLR